MSMEAVKELFFNFERKEDEKIIEPIIEITSSSVQKGETTLAKRLEIIQKLEEGVSINKLCIEYGLHKRTIQRYWKNVESLRKISRYPKCLSMKRNRVAPHEEINIRLHKWMLERQADGDIFTDSILQEKAKELHKEIGVKIKFTASRGWLWRFKKKYNVNVPNLQEEMSFTNDLTSDKLAKILNENDVKIENVYNIHEKRLMWRALPQMVLSHEGETMRMNHVTIALCSNATGTHKLPLLFINKYANPQALKHCRQMLPVVYISQNSARLDEIVFNDWYTNHFKPTVRQYQQQKQRVGKVMLLVDRSKNNLFFEKEEEDLHFKLVSLPLDMYPIVQPMEEGVIRKCKTLFRQKLLCRIQQYNGRIKEFYGNYDIKDSIDLISEAWDEITMLDIKYSWRKLLQQDPIVLIIKENPENCEESKFSEETTKWILECEEQEESTVEENMNNTNAHHCSSLEEEEIDRMFHKLETWAKTKPDFIKSSVTSLIQYSNRQYYTK